MLPAAVKISLSLRREVPKSVLGFGDSGKPPTVVYSLLVSLPNASVDANLTASEQEEAMPASTTDMSQQSSPLNKQKGHNPNSSKQDNPNQQKNRKPPKDPTQKKSTKPTNPINPPKPRINPQKQPINPQTKPSPTVPVTPKTPTKS